jgi:osmotically-inducible protein OsmY
MQTQQRSDVELNAAVVDEFDRTPGLDAVGIRVAVRNGAATLTGTGGMLLIAPSDTCPA